MSLLVVGSVALDTVETPHGKAEEVIGGSAVYFSLAAALFTEVRLAGVVGNDFPEAGFKLLHEKGIELVEPAELTGALKGRGNAYNQLDTMIKSAEEEVILITTENGLPKSSKRSAEPSRRQR